MQSAGICEQGVKRHVHFQSKIWGKLCRTERNRRVFCLCRTAFLEWKRASGTKVTCNARVDEWQIVVREAVIATVEAETSSAVNRKGDLVVGLFLGVNMEEVQKTLSVLTWIVDFQVVKVSKSECCLCEASVSPPNCFDTWKNLVGRRFGIRKNKCRLTIYKASRTICRASSTSAMDSSSELPNHPEFLSELHRFIRCLFDETILSISLWKPVNVSDFLLCKLLCGTVWGGRTGVISIKMQSATRSNVPCFEPCTLLLRLIARILSYRLHSASIQHHSIVTFFSHFLQTKYTWRSCLHPCPH